MTWYFTSYQSALSRSFNMQHVFCTLQKFPSPVPTSGKDPLYPESILDTHAKKFDRHRRASRSYGNFSGLMPARAGRFGGRPLPECVPACVPLPEIGTPQQTIDSMVVHAPLPSGVIRN